MANSNQTLDSAPLSTLMRQYAVPYIISLLVGALVKRMLALVAPLFACLLCLALHAFVKRGVLSYISAQ